MSTHDDQMASLSSWVSQKMSVAKYKRSGLSCVVSSQQQQEKIAAATGKQYTSAYTPSSNLRFLFT